MRYANHEIPITVTVKWYRRLQIAYYCVGLMPIQTRYINLKWEILYILGGVIDFKRCVRRSAMPIIYNQDAVHNNISLLTYYTHLCIIFYISWIGIIFMIAIHHLTNIYSINTEVFIFSQKPQLLSVNIWFFSCSNFYTCNFQIFNPR